MPTISNEQLVSILVSGNKSLLNDLIKNNLLSDTIKEFKQTSKLSAGLIVNAGRLAAKHPGDLFKIWQKRNNYLADPDFIKLLLEAVFNHALLNDFVKNNENITNIINIATTQVKKMLASNAYAISDLIGKGDINLKNFINTLDDVELSQLIGNLFANANLLNILSANTNDLVEIIQLYPSSSFSQEKYDEFNKKIEQLAIKIISNSLEFRQFLYYNKAILAKLVKSTISEIPEIKSILPDMNAANIEKLVTVILDRDLITKILENKDNNKNLLKIIAQEIPFLAPNIAISLISAVSHAVVGDITNKAVFNVIEEELVAYHATNPDRKTIENFYDVCIKPALEKSKLKIEKPRLDNISINGKDNQINLSKFIIEDLSFINSKITNVSFKNSVFHNVIFTGAKLNQVDFSGATMDAATLKSLVASARKNKISLDGVKVHGDLSNIDLSDLSFRNADFSGVTNLNKVNLKNTDLEGIILADNKQLNYALHLHQAKNIDGLKIMAKSVFQRPVFLGKTINKISENQKDVVLKNIVDIIAAKAHANETHEVLLDKEKKAMVKELSSPELYQKLEPIFEDFLAKGGIENPDFLKFPNLSQNTSKDFNSSTVIMTILYNNRHSPELIANKVAAVHDSILRKKL